MTPAQVAHIMSLVDKFAETCVRPVTLENVKVAEKARAAVEAALRDAPQAEPVAWGIRWQGHGPIMDCITPEEHERHEGEYTVPLFATPLTEAKPAQDAVDADDPLQGAVDWLLQADGEFFCVATVQRTLRIGYNRANRLSEVAKERAAISAKKGGQP